MKRFVVSVQRIAFSATPITVEAENRQEAVGKALDQAPDLDFRGCTYESNYSAEVMDELEGLE